MKVELYQPARKGEWDSFVTRSKNGTFMHLRGFIEYHEVPFDDHSLMISNAKDSLVALLPANKKNGVLASHRGLTYAGFITNDEMTMPLMLEVFESALSFLKRAGFSQLVYKTTPRIHHRLPADEDAYALYLAGATLVGRDVWPVINSRCRLPFQERRQRGVKKALKAGLVVRQSSALADYWSIVAELLARYGAKPVHSPSELAYLQCAFPENVKLFGCFQGEAMVAGVLIFETDRVARAQYIAATDQGKASGALDLLFDRLINDHYSKKPFFDFGTTTTAGGQHLNKGLSDQKEGFGARSIVHDRYELDINAWRSGTFERALD